ADLERRGVITTAQQEQLVTAANDAAQRAREDARRAIEGLLSVEEERIIALRKIADLEKQGVITAEERIRLEAEANEKAEDRRLEESEDTIDGIKRAMRKMAEDAEDSADRAERALTGAFDAAGDSLKEMVRNGELDLERLGDALFDLLFELAAAEAQKAVIKPVLSFIGSTLGLVAADGAVMDHGMPVTAFRKGGVTTGPTFFPMANGQTGLMGEDGEEAIMPLKRTADGALGVRAVLPDMRGAGGGGATVIFAPNIKVEVAGGASGDAAADRKFGEQISEQITGALLEMVDERIVDQMRIGGIINPLGNRGFGG
ncbi:MAG: phage tail tape measure C-terminal domain-containing protein, partial [Minwuia sp.]|nr:phage tail tape measure C-terminal domain-containing protein [Minwuia sp.]